MIVAIDSHKRSPTGVIFASDQLSPKFDDAHLSVHDLEQHPAENVELLEECFMLGIWYFWVFHSLRHQLPQLQVVLGQQKNSKLESTYLAHLHIVEPTESIRQQFSVRSTHHSLEILLPQVALLFPVQKSEQGDAVEEGNVGQRLPVLLYCLWKQDHLCEDVGEDGPRFDRQHVLLVVGHGLLFDVLIKLSHLGVKIYWQYTHTMQ